MLQLNNIKLRALEPEDLELIYEWENNTDIWLVSNTITPFSKYILKKYIENSHRDIFETKQLRLMIEVKEKKWVTIGTIDLFDFDPLHKRAGVGILIANKKYRNRGYAKTTLTILKNYSFQILKLHQLYCNISADNKISLSLFKNANFKIIGEKKDWLKTSKGWTNEFILQCINK